MDTLVTERQEQALRFVRSLQLAPYGGVLGDTTETDETEPYILEEDEEQADVDAGSVVSFVSGLSKLHKSDVLNGTLYAQLAANYKYNRETHVKEWYGFYHYVLENIGWTLSTFNFTEYETKGSSLEIDKAVIELVAVVAGNKGRALVAIAEKALASLKSQPDDSKPFKVWDTNTHKAGNGSFQILPCAEDDGNVAMALCAFHFKATLIKARFLWAKYNSIDISLYQSGMMAVLNEETYGYVREDIKKALGNNAKEFVANLPLKAI